MPGPMADSPENETSVSFPDVELNDGTSIPQLGFGVFLVPQAQTRAAVKTALGAGYRHIDTAQMYGNEAGVADGIAASDVDRADIFVTSKLNNGFHEPDDARRAFDQTLFALDSDYVDLFLIHWPLPTRYGGDFLSTWKVLEEFKADGRARSIGVSNFNQDHLEAIAAGADTAPAINQIELHPYLVNRELADYCQAQGIAVESWSPLAKSEAIADPVIVDIAEAVGHTPAQVILRWHVEHGYIVIPKSVTPSRVAENTGIFDFSLDEAQIAAIDALDRGESGRTGPDPATFDWLG